MRCPACGTDGAYQGLGKPECVKAGCEFYKASAVTGPNQSQAKRRINVRVVGALSYGSGTGAVMRLRRHLDGAETDICGQSEHGVGDNIAAFAGDSDCDAWLYNQAAPPPDPNDGCWVTLRLDSSGRLVSP